MVLRQVRRVCGKSRKPLYSVSVFVAVLETHSSTTTPSRYAPKAIAKLLAPADTATHHIIANTP